MLDVNSCIICRDSISDPVCRGCYIKQINILLDDIQMHSLAKDIILNKVKGRFLAENLNDTRCILCRKEDVSLCRHCFSIILTSTLRELNFTEELIRGFGYNLIHENSLEKGSRDRVEVFFDNVLEKKSN